MERAKLAPPGTRPDATEELAGGWRREIATGEWQPGIELIKVTVTMPDGGAFNLYRLRQERESVNGSIGIELDGRSLRAVRVDGRGGQLQRVLETAWDPDGPAEGVRRAA